MDSSMTTGRLTADTLTEDTHGADKIEKLTNEAVLPDEVKTKIAESVACSAMLAGKKAAIETRIADLKQQLNDIRTSNPDFYPLLSEKDYKAKMAAYDSAKNAYKVAIKKSNNELMPTHKNIDDKKLEISEKLLIRGKALPRNDDEWRQYQVIRDMMSDLDDIKNRNQIPSPPSQKDNEFFERYFNYYIYEASAEAWFKTRSEPINNQMSQFRAELVPIQQALEEEIWRPKYLTYAYENDLQCDDENIYRVCNQHHMEELLDDWWFDCPCGVSDCDCYYCHDLDHEEHGHSYNRNEGQCTRGTKMMVEWNVDNLCLGFIEKNYPAGAYVMLK
jgi:hypothetical protein